MHYLEAVVAVLFLICVINGFRKGFLRMVLSFGTLAIALIISMFGYHYVARMMNQYTGFSDLVQTQIEDTLELDTGKNVKKRSKQTKKINELPLPQTLIEGLNENNNEEMYEALRVNTFYEYIARYLAMVVSNSAAFLITYLLAFLVLKVIMALVDMITELPIIHGINKVGGILLGGLEGVLAVWLLFLVINIISGSGIGQTLLAYTRESPYLSIIYDKNIIMDGITNLSNILF